MKNIPAEKKATKKDARVVGWSVILYMLISVLGGFVASFIGEQLGCDIGTLGIFLIPLVAFGAVVPFFRKKVSFKELFKKEKTMTASAFLRILCLFFGICAASGIVRIALEIGLNQFGLTTMPQVLEDALTGKDIFTILSICVLAPIAEELLFRGLIMRVLEKHSKKLAIVVSAVLFALMHGNLQQSINAFGLGLVLGYVATEYSLKWSILLHFMQNAILSTLLPVLLPNLYIILFFALYAVGLVAGTVILIRRRHEIAAWCKANTWERNKMLWVLTTVSIVLFVALMVAFIAVFTIVPV